MDLSLLQQEVNCRKATTLRRKSSPDLNRRLGGKLIYGGDGDVIAELTKGSGQHVGTELLLNYAERIRRAWHLDRSGGEPYPLNTAAELSELEAKLKGRIPPRLQFEPVPKNPKRLKDILPEYVVRLVHECLYEEPFTHALDKLHTLDFDRALARIQNTVTTALAVDLLGAGMLPKPRGNWIHRQILRIVRAANPGRLSDTEIAEFFNQLCPCGIKQIAKP